MPNLKLGPIADDRPVRLTIALPAQVHRMLLTYAELHGRLTGQAAAPDKLMPAMLERFMLSDRIFAREWRKRARHDGPGGPTT
jgi:hypothetical protein